MFTITKKHTSEHPLPDRRPDLKSQANFGLKQTFIILKISKIIFHLAESIKVTVRHSNASNFSRPASTKFSNT